MELITDMTTPATMSFMATDSAHKDGETTAAENVVAAQIKRAREVIIHGEDILPSCKREYIQELELHYDDLCKEHDLLQCQKVWRILVNDFSAELNLRRLPEFRYLTVLELRDVLTVKDEHIEALPNLEILDVSGCESISTIANPNLMCLCLHNVSGVEIRPSARRRLCVLISSGNFWFWDHSLNLAAYPRLHLLVTDEYHKIINASKTCMIQRNENSCITWFATQVGFYKTLHLLYFKRPFADSGRCTHRHSLLMHQIRHRAPAYKNILALQQIRNRHK